MGEYFFRDDLAVPVSVDLQRVALPNPQRPPYFLWDHHTPQFIDPAHNSRCSHKACLLAFLIVLALASMEF